MHLKYRILMNLERNVFVLQILLLLCLYEASAFKVFLKSPIWNVYYQKVCLPTSSLLWQVDTSAVPQLKLLWASVLFVSWTLWKHPTSVMSQNPHPDFKYLCFMMSLLKHFKNYLQCHSTDWNHDHKHQIK